MGASRVLWCVATALTGLLIASNVSAFEVLSANTHFEDKEFRVELDLILNAPPERVQSVLRDYDDYARLDAGIMESRVLDRVDAETVMLFTKLRACAGVFCRTVKRVERVQERSFELLATAIPDQSDVVSGHTHTVLQTLDSQTRVRYTTAVVPKFWVPGFIGRPLMLRTLREASLELFRNIETRARQ